MAGAGSHACSQLALKPLACRRLCDSRPAGHPSRASPARGTLWQLCRHPAEYPLSPNADLQARADPQQLLTWCLCEHCALSCVHYVQHAQLGANSHGEWPFCMMLQSKLLPPDALSCHVLLGLSGQGQERRLLGPCQAGAARDLLQAAQRSLVRVLCIEHGASVCHRHLSCRVDLPTARSLAPCLLTGQEPARSAASHVITAQA